MMTPKFILSKQKVFEQYNKCKCISDGVSYSSKTNPLITPILEKNTDSLFSIHMKNELKNIQDKSRVLFLAQAWNDELIEELFELGISKFVVDNEADLDILLHCLRDQKTKITLFLRLKLKENTLRTEKYFVFGMASDVMRKRISEINNSNITLGIHFHRKTQNLAEWNYQYELENLPLDKIKLINIGGGLPAEYANTNIKVIDGIVEKIKQLKKWLNSKNIKLMLEPGRFISAPAIKLVTKIISIYDNNIIVDASVYNSDMDALIVPVKLLVDGELTREVANKSNAEKRGHPYVIKGLTPCSMDLFRYRVYLDNPVVGDTLTFLNAGAYNFTTEFCDLDKIETMIVE